MNPFTLIAGLGFLVSLVATWTLVVLAFRTDDALGILCFLIPFFATTIGNHRIRSPHARRLALVSWAGLAVSLLSFVLMPR